MQRLEQYCFKICSINGLMIYIISPDSEKCHAKTVERCCRITGCGWNAINRTLNVCRILEVSVISTKGKRKLEYNGINYYWYIRRDSDYIPCIHIVSEDKTLQLTFGFDREIGVGIQYVKKLLARYLEEKGFIP